MTREEVLKVAKPILFNTDMVRAIQDGRKTVTRRVIKPRFREKECGFFTATIAGQLFLCYSDEDGDETRRVKAPYQVGDILYVRETWVKIGSVLVKEWRYVYKADVKEECFSEHFWNPSIHMPKEAARIFLRVTDIRVERLQDMKMSDIKAEGVVPLKVTGGQWQQWQRDYMKPVWDSTVKKTDLDKYGWAANPWVWVIEFERIEIDQ